MGPGDIVHMEKLRRLGCRDPSWPRSVPAHPESPSELMSAETSLLITGTMR